MAFLVRYSGTCPARPNRPERGARANPFSDPTPPFDTKRSSVGIWDSFVFDFPFSILYCRAMTKNPAVLRAIELLLCVWVFGSQIWYLAQFRSLVEFAARRIFHRG